MEGFLGESSLREKAVLIGRTVLRQSEQIIIPDIKFTCSGTLSQWRFVAQRFGVSGGRNKYPEIQIWRPQNRWIYNKIYSETFWPQEADQRSVYTHTLSTPLAYQDGDVLGIYHPPSAASVYRIYSVEYGGPENYRLDRQQSARTQFDLRGSTVRTDQADYPLVGIVTNNPQCGSGFLSNSVMNTRARALSGSDSFVALSNQQRLIPSLTYNCRGRIGRILVAGQNRGSGGNRNQYPEIQLMRPGVLGYYNRIAVFTLSELDDVNSPNVLEFVASGTFSSIYTLPGDVIKIYQPQKSTSVYSVYHEPGTGPTNYYINGINIITTATFPTTSVSSTDRSRPLIIVQLMAKCPPLGSPSNGNVEHSDSVATYSCNNGYRLDGPEQRLCNNNTAQWQGQAPVCTFVNCGNPPRVAHGTYTLSRRTVLNSVATYSCSSQYVLAGSNVRRCELSGEWSGQTPTCKRQCRSPSRPSHGSMTVDSQPLEGDTARFSCDDTYDLIGSSIILCQSNGQWSSQEPTCDLIQCPPLTSPANGRVTLDTENRVVGSVAVYHCNSGYELMGQVRRVCQRNRQWTAQDPTCQLIQCPVLVSPPNGRVQVTTTAVGGIARYSCDRGYQMEGRESQTCQEDGHWSEQPPSCEPIDCGIPPRPTNGDVRFQSGTQLNDIARYSCSDGYWLDGNEERVCEESSQWSGQLPVCQAIDCGPPPALPNGEIVSTNGTRVYDTAIYSCNVGYRLTGDDRLVCQHSAVWSASGPTCSEVDCGRLSHPENGEVILETTGYGSVARFACNIGYMLTGIAERVCLESGTWSYEAPICYKTSISFTIVPSMSPIPPESSLEVLLPITTATLTASTTVSEDPALTMSFLHPSESSPHPDTSSATNSSIPISNDSAADHTNIFIICGVIGLMLCVITLLALLIVVVYARKKKIHAMAAATANSVENPVYLGHGGTPYVNCFEVGSRNGCGKQHPSGTGLQDFGYQTTQGSEKHIEDQFSMSLHVYDFPTLQNGRHGSNGYGHYEQEGNGNAGHSYEFPGHYHLATQYEIPVTPYEHPKSQATSRIYKNTLPSDVYVPTLEERKKSVSIDRRRQLMKRSFTLSPGPAEEKVFFEESTTYWRPASDPATLYEQLAKNKYREICRKHVQVTELLGSGQFGMVNKGVWQRPGGATDVAIKTLREGATEEDKIRFLQEAATSGQFQHPNVVKLQGVVTVGEPIMIILELLPNGDLRDYLIKQRPVPGEIMEDDWPRQLLKFSQDISSGMDYLSSKAFVHRDLAARNILVADDRTCKIGDFGMSRDLVEEDYYISNGGKIPVKWTAPEALHYKKYSSASDVWSFGVLMFELWSLGCKPFDKYSNAEAIKRTDQGLRLPPPPGCPRAIYKLMIQCWHPRTSLRPTFYALVHTLSQDAKTLLSWNEEDSSVHPQATVLGAPLEAGLGLYIDLQRIYVQSVTIV